MDVKFVDFQSQFSEEESDLMALVREALKSGMFVGGPQITELEARLADYCNVSEVIAVNSGTDALMLAMAGLGIGHGDEVITPPNSFVASTAAIVHIGATPVFADVLPDQNIDPNSVARVITSKTKAIMAVHLTGRIADMNSLKKLADEHGLSLIEDAAQSVGSEYHGERAGSIGDAGCFSAHPLKNLNAIGDAGYVTTNNQDLAEKLRHKRNHGLVDRNTVEEFGLVSRMDTLNAAVLLKRLDMLPKTIELRRRNATLYQNHLNPDHVFFPPCQQHEFNTFHTFVIQIDRRDELQAHLGGQGIGSSIHYPVPIHLQPAAEKYGHKVGDFPVVEKQAERILSLPIHQHLTEEQVLHVAETVNRFFD